MAKRRPMPGPTAYAEVQAGAVRGGALFSARLRRRLDAFRQAIRRRAESRRRRAEPGAEPAVRLEVPSPEIIYSTANEKSQIAFARLSDVLRRWTEQIGEENLAASGVPRAAARPFSGRKRRRGRRRPSRRVDVVENAAGAAAALGPDRRVLPGRRPVRRREGAGHAGDAAVQPRRAERDRGGQAGDRHALQHGHGRAEPGEHRH